MLILRSYKSTEEHNNDEAFFRDFDTIKTYNQELMMYMSVLAKMVATSNKSCIENLPNSGDRKLAKILIDMQDNEDIGRLKEFQLLNEKVNILLNPRKNTKKKSIKSRVLQSVLKTSMRNLQIHQNEPKAMLH